MATFHRTPRGSAYLDISMLELSEYSHNPIPVCDECLQDMRGLKSITLIPILIRRIAPDVQHLCCGGWGVTRKTPR